MRCDPADTGCTVPSDGSAGSFGTLLSGPMYPVTDDITYWERLEALGGDTYDYVEGIDSQPGSFDYDDPRDYGEWCAWNDVDIEEGYYDPFQPNEGGGFVSPGDAFGMDTDTVVVASVVCEAKQVDLQIPESLGLCSDIGSGNQGKPIWGREICWTGWTCRVLFLLGLRRPRRRPEIRRSPLVWSVSISMVDFGSGPPVLLLGKDVLELVGVVLNATDVAAAYHRSVVCSLHQTFSVFRR